MCTTDDGISISFQTCQYNSSEAQICHGLTIIIMPLPLVSTAHLEQDSTTMLKTVVKSKQG